MIIVAVTAPGWLPNLPWSRRWIARQIEQRVGLACSIERLWPVGFDGRIHVSGLRMWRAGDTAPAGPSSASLVFLPAASADVRWSALRRGRLELEVVTIEGGEINWQPPAAPSDESEEMESLRTRAVELSAAAAPTVVATTPHGLFGLVPLADLVDANAVSPPPELAPAAPAAPGPAAPVPAAAAEVVTMPPVGVATTPSFSPLPPASPPPTLGNPTGPPSPAATVAVARRWSLDRIRISRLRMRILAPGTGGREWASTVVTADVPLVATASATGAIRVARLVVAGRAWPGEIVLPLAWDGEVLTSVKSPVACPGGTALVSFRSQPLLPGAPVLGDVSFADLSLATGAAWLGVTIPPPEGTASGQLQFAGLARYPKTFRSIGVFQTRGLVLPVRQWLQEAGLAAWADRWPAPTLVTRTVEATFRSAGGQVAVDDASLFSEDLTVRALGTATVSGGPNLSVRAYFPPGGAELVSRMGLGWPPERQVVLTPFPNSPWHFFDTVLQGSWSAPAIGLWDRLWTMPELRTEVQALTTRSAPSG